MKRWIIGTFLISCVLLLTACNIQQTGYVVAVEEDRLLILKGKTQDQYAKVANKPTIEMLEEGFNLTYYYINEAQEFAIGDHVKIWTDGISQTSYPEQATAYKIKRIK